MDGIVSAESSRLRKGSNTQESSEIQVLRLMLFLSKVIRSGARECDTVLGVGFLDILLSLSHYYGFERIYKDPKDKEREAYQLYIACNAALLDVTAYAEFRSFVAGHRIISLWPCQPNGMQSEVFPFHVRRKAMFLGPDCDVVLGDHYPFVNLSL